MLKKLSDRSIYTREKQISGFKESSTQVHYKRFTVQKLLQSFYKLLQSVARMKSPQANVSLL